MAKLVKPVEQVVEDLDEMDVEEIDAMEQELVEKTEEKKGKAPKKSIIGANQVGTADVAAMLGTTARDLRMFLRKNFRDMTKEKGQTYVWEKDSPELQAVLDTYKAKKNAPKAKKEAKAETPVDVPQTNAAPIDLDDFDLEEDL
jgi:hypothetical protein